MNPLVQVQGVAVPIDRDNVDTDAVIPVPWMKAMEPDYARALFANWRWRDGDGVHEIPDFILNQEPFRQARIVVAAANFGCGSSREAAVWALAGFGIRCVIASSFGDIFYENAFKNGLLPLVLPADDCARLREQLARREGGARMTVDLERQEVIAPDGGVVRFAIDPARRAALLAGLDEIGMTLRDREAIDAFQRRDRERHPWVYEPAMNADPAPEGLDAP